MNRNKLLKITIVEEKIKGSKAINPLLLFWLLASCLLLPAARACFCFCFCLLLCFARLPMLLPLLLRNCRGRFGKRRKKPPSPQNAAARTIHSLTREGKKKKKKGRNSKKENREISWKKKKNSRGLTSFRTFGQHPIASHPPPVSNHTSAPLPSWCDATASDIPSYYAEARMLQLHPISRVGSVPSLFHFR